MNLSTENFHLRFQDLTRLLLEHSSLWSESPFVNDELAWFREYPVLHSELLALTGEEVTVLDDETALLVRLSVHLPELRSLANWRIPADDRPGWQTPKKAMFGLPERKRRQTEGFVTSLWPLLERTETEVSKGSRIVDWCSGRGLLARQLYYAGGTPVLCLERDPELCRSGQLANGKMDTAMSGHVSFASHDILQPIACEHLENAYLHTALHACGDLHLTMLKAAVSAHARVIACSPCCYHLMKSEVYSGLSQEGRRSGLTLTKDQLRLATAETTTANTLERELRYQELLWRVAFDLHLRELSGVDEYCRMPSITKSLLKKSFADFVRSMLTAVQKMGVRAVKPFPLSEKGETALLTKAEGKMAVIRRLEKARLGFRKALEYWLLLDRVLFLQDQGYDVELREFCQKRDSGRNSLILGRLPPEPNHFPLGE